MPLRNLSDIDELLSSGAPKILDLHEAWNHRRPIYSADQKKSRYGSSEAAGIPWLDDTSLAQRFVARAVQAEEFLLAIDAAREILRGWETAPEDQRTDLIHVRMDYAKALTHLGFTREARRELQPCLKPPLWPTLGPRLKTDLLLQLGKILREESNNAASKAEQLSSGGEALEYYKQALKIDPRRLDAMVGSASLALLLAGRSDSLRAVAQESARGILEHVSHRQQVEALGCQTVWARASAQAILGNLEEAHKSFELLQGMDGANTAYLAGVRFEAQFLAEAQGKPRDFFKQAFPPLQLIVFAGHLPDRAKKKDGTDAPARLPPEAIPEAREALRVRLKEMGARAGLVSASAGADLLFAEAIEDRKGTLHLVLPWSQDEFLRTSVLPYESEGNSFWEPLFKRAVACASTTREVGQVYEPGSDLGWDFMMEVSAGIALHTARTLRLDLQPMVLWDGLPGRGAGGTSSFHDFWKLKMGIEPIVVRPPALPPQVQSFRVGGSESRGCQTPTIHQEVKSMLFADIVGYSKLTEKAIPAYIEVFLKRLGQLASTSKHAPCNVNTWGDALYAVFDFATDAGLFALEMAEMIQEGKADWLREGLYSETRSEDGSLQKHTLNVRIGLHTGPVVMLYDPIVRRVSFTGAHVTRAARIEPIAEPGQAFASEEFVAMVELSSKTGKQQSKGVSSAEIGFVCEYAGSMQLAKSYPGRHRIYRVVRKRGLVLETLARAAHEAFCSLAGSRVGTPTASLLPWEELSDDLKEANRAQVADIPNQLRLLGLELASGAGQHASQLMITVAQMEEMAAREHDRWAGERLRQGWTYGSERDNARKLHPSIVTWGQLSESEREKDRDVIRALPKLIEKAGFNLKPID